MLALAFAAALATAAPAGAAEVASAATIAALRSYPTDGLNPVRARLEALGRAGDVSAWEALGQLLNRFGGKDAATRAEVCDSFEHAAAVRRDSAHKLATCYYSGDGRPRDLAKAEFWYQKAIERGLIKSRCALGNLMIARALPLGSPRGVGLCKSGADTGDADAQTDYGQYLLTAPRGRDPVAARLLFAKAAAQGQANAAYLLGLVHWNGDGTPKDNQAAAQAWMQAFNGGRRDAAYLLGNEAMVRVTRLGRLQGPDRAALEEAVRWYGIAVTDDPDAANRAKAAEHIKLLGELRGAFPAPR